MKKLIYLASILLLCPLFVNGQAFEKGTKVVAAGIGVGSSLGSFNYSSQLPAISLQYEQGVWDIGGPGVISLGGYIGYKSYKYTVQSATFESTSKWNYTLLGVRSAYHYTGLDNDKLDVYGGLMLGYYILNHSYRDNSGFVNNSGGNFGNTAGVSIYVGGRYYFTDQLGAFGELGYGVSYLNLGVVLKL